MPRKEVHGSARVYTVKGQQVLKIKTSGQAKPSFYVLKQFETDPKAAKLGILLLGDRGQRYNVVVDLHGQFHCDCPDHNYRPDGECKHAKAIRAIYFTDSKVGTIKEQA